MVPKTTNKPLVEDVASYLDIQTRNAIGTVTADAEPEEKMARLREQAGPEFEDLFAEPYSGVTWYEDDARIANENLKAAFPELRDNEYLATLQKAMSAILSNGQYPQQEAYYGAKLWEEHRKNISEKNPAGRIPLRQPNGMEWPGWSITDQLVKLQRMLDDLGLDGTIQYLMTPKTIQQLKETYRPSAKGPADKVVSGSVVFGEKIGRYFLDLMGVQHDGSTMDKWDCRGMNRRLGRLMRRVPVTPKAPTGRVIGEVPSPDSERDLFMALHQELARAHGIRLPSGARSVLWHYEQELYRRLGLAAESEARSTGTARYLRESGINVPSAKGESRMYRQTHEEDENEELTPLNEQELQELLLGWERLKATRKKEDVTFGKLVKRASTEAEKYQHQLR